LIFAEVTDKNKLTPFYGPQCTGQSALAGMPQVRTGSFSSCKLLMPTCPCWWHLAHWD